jgi:hypothetical protein
LPDFILKVKRAPGCLLIFEIKFSPGLAANPGSFGFRLIHIAHPLSPGGFPRRAFTTKIDIYFAVRNFETRHGVKILNMLIM